MLPSNMFISLASNFNIMLIRFSTPLLKRMENINGILELRHIDDAPFSQDVDSNFLHPMTYAGHGLPIVRLKSGLNGI